MILSGFLSSSNTVHITGQLKRNQLQTDEPFIGISIIAKAGNKVLAQSLVDEQGNFNLTFNPSKKRPVDFFVESIPLGTALVASVKSFNSDTSELNFYYPSIIKKNKHGQILCPKCERADMVCEVSYGIGGVIIENRPIPNRNDTTHAPSNCSFDAGRCQPGIAKYYCYRDKVKF